MSGVRKPRHGSKDVNGGERSPPVMICLSNISEPLNKDLDRDTSQFTETN